MATRRDHDPRELHDITQFFVNAGKRDALRDHGEVARLVRVYQSSSHEGERRKAFTQLLEGNLRFIIACAMKFRGRGLPVADLVQEGSIGFEEAIRRFNPDKGISILSYAVSWIKLSMREAVRKQGNRFSYTIPIKDYRLVGFMGIAQDRFYARCRRLPDNKELLDEIRGLPYNTARKITLRMVARKREILNRKHVSLDERLWDYSERTLHNTIPSARPTPEAILSARELLCGVEQALEKIDAAINLLPERSASVLRLHAGFGVEQGAITLKVIAAQYVMTRESARRIFRHAFLKLKGFGLDITEERLLQMVDLREALAEIVAGDIQHHDAEKRGRGKSRQRKYGFSSLEDALDTVHAIAYKVALPVIE